MNAALPQYPSEKVHKWRERSGGFKGVGVNLTGWSSNETHNWHFYCGTRQVCECVTDKIEMSQTHARTQTFSQSRTLTYSVSWVNSRDQTSCSLISLPSGWLGLLEVLSRPRQWKLQGHVTATEADISFFSFTNSHLISRHWSVGDNSCCLSILSDESRLEENVGAAESRMIYCLSLWMNNGHDGEIIRLHRPGTELGDSNCVCNAVLHCIRVYLPAFANSWL